jgi:hypothetical protein
LVWPGPRSQQPRRGKAFGLQFFTIRFGKSQIEDVLGDVAGAIAPSDWRYVPHPERSEFRGIAHSGRLKPEGKATAEAASLTVWRFGELTCFGGLPCVGGFACEAAASLMSSAEALRRAIAMMVRRRDETQRDTAENTNKRAALQPALRRPS